MSNDPLAPLLGIPGVTSAVDSARDAIANVHRHPANQRGWASTAAEASVRAARASAALDGADVAIPPDGAVTDPVLAGSLRVADAIGLLLPVWRRAPLQALARLHVLAAADLVEADNLGRPRLAPGMTDRLELLANLVVGGSTVPAPVLAAVVHGELLALGPFERANGVVARAAARLTMVATGLDPKGLVVPEVAYLRRGAGYAAAAAGFANGTPGGVGEWLVFCCSAITDGAREAAGIANAAR